MEMENKTPDFDYIEKMAEEYAKIKVNKFAIPPLSVKSVNINCNLDKASEANLLALRENQIEMSDICAFIYERSGRQEVRETALLFLNISKDICQRLEAFYIKASGENPPIFTHNPITTPLGWAIKRLHLMMGRHMALYQNTIKCKALARLTRELPLLYSRQYFALVSLSLI